MGDVGRWPWEASVTNFSLEKKKKKKRRTEGFETDLLEFWT